MRKRLLTAFAAALSLFGLNTNVLADDFEVQPTQVTTISEVTADDVLYDASAAEWKIACGKVSGNKFTSPALSYNSSSVALVKLDASAYKNLNITKAELQLHSYCTVATKNSQILVASVDGTDLDLSTATWNSVNSAGATISEIYKSDDWWVGDSGADLTANITDYLTNDEDKVLILAFYTGTDRQQAISNIKLVLSTDEQKKYTYSVKATDGTNELKVLAEGQDTEGAAITVAYPKYLLGTDGTLYSTKGKDNKEFNYSFALNSDAQVENIVYTAGATDVVYLVEGEDIEGAKVLSDGNASIRASKSKTGYNDEQDLKITTLPAGKYKMTVGVFDSGKTPSAVFSFVSGETALFDAAATTTNLTETTSEEFTLTGASNDIVLKAGGSSSSQRSIDYIYIQKTGDVEVAEPAYAVGKLTFTDLEGVSAGRIDAGTVYDGGDFTVTVNKGDASFREFSNVRYFELTSGSFTVKGANGKKLNRIAFAGNVSAFLKADGGEFKSSIWTGDADSVVFTNSTFQSSITAITVGDYKEPTKDAENIAAAIALGKDAEVKLKLDGTHVTIVHDGYAYIQDETGGLRVENADLNLQAGTDVTGYICGKYASTSGVPTLQASLNTVDSKFESAATTFVPAIANGRDLNADKYVNQVVKIIGDMVVQDLGGFVVIQYDNAMLSFVDGLGVLPEDYVLSQDAGSIVALVAPYGEIWPVSADSIVMKGDLKPVYVSNIKGLKSMPSGLEVALNLAGAVVTVDEMANTTVSGGSDGVMPQAEGTRTILVEDTTGVVTINADIAEALPAVFTGDSIALTGSLIATVNNNYGLISMYASDKTASSTIETAAAEVKPTVMTVADSKNEDNANMLIQYADVTVSGTAGKYQVVQDGATIDLVDVFNKMQYAEGDSAQMVLPEGNVNINGILSYENTTDTYEFWPISYESAVVPEYAVGKLTFSDLEGVSTGRIDAGTVYDCGDFTVTVNKGDASFREFNNVRYFDLTTGSFTVKGANGKKLNRIAFAGNVSAFLKADGGTFKSSVWTGDADSVVFTNSTFQSSITAITVGDFKEPTKDAANIAAAIALGKDAEVKLMLNGTNVTINHNGYAFIQDETGGLRVENKDLNLKAGTAAKGYICGKYANIDGIPTLVTSPNTADSKFESVDTTFIPTIATGSGLNSDKYVNQVVKLLGNMNVQDYGEGLIAIEYDNVNVIFADSLNVLPENYIFPENVGSIVALVAPYGEIWPVSADSIVSADDLKPIYISNIKGLKSMPSGVDVALNLAGAVVTVDEMANTTVSGGSDGVMPQAEGTRTIIVEDTTGAVTINADIAEALPAVFTGDSIALTGSLIATVYNYYGQVSMYASDETASSTIETAAAEVKPTVMTVADSKNEDYSNMLIQYADVTVNGAGGKYQVVQDGATVDLVDVFNKMQYTEGDSAEMVLPEGNVNINGILSYDANNDAYEFWPISYEAAAKETVYKEITETEVFLPTEDNIAAAVAEGWVVDGGTRAKKSGNVDPATGEVLDSPKSFDGVGLKKGNSAKMFQTNVTGVDEITAYAVTGSSTDTRVFVVTATPSDGGEPIVVTAESAPKVTAVVTLTLDANKKYVIDYTGTEIDGAGGDMALQGIKFTKISSGINEVNAEVKVENQNVYTINGVMVRKAGESLGGLAKGLYIIGGKKVVIK